MLNMIMMWSLEELIRFPEALQYSTYILMCNLPLLHDPLPGKPADVGYPDTVCNCILSFPQHQIRTWRQTVVMQQQLIAQKLEPTCVLGPARGNMIILT